MNRRSKRKSFCCRNLNWLAYFQRLCRTSNDISRLFTFHHSGVESISHRADPNCPLCFACTVDASNKPGCNESLKNLAEVIFEIQPILKRLQAKPHTDNLVSFWYIFIQSFSIRWVVQRFWGIPNIRPRFWFVSKKKIDSTRLLPLLWFVLLMERRRGTGAGAARIYIQMVSTKWYADENQYT